MSFMSVSHRFPAKINMSSKATMKRCRFSSFLEKDKFCPFPSLLLLSRSFYTQKSHLQFDLLSLVNFAWITNINFQDIKLENRMKKKIAKRELQLWEICVILGKTKTEICVKIHISFVYKKWNAQISKRTENRSAKQKILQPENKFSAL